jgi:transcription initiation factor TFIIIB Brf1 subunit/transcription initiation factor TFIIB
MDKCRYCGLRGLVLSMANADYACEHCGEYQKAILDSVWDIVGYEKESA